MAYGRPHPSFSVCPKPRKTTKIVVVPGAPTGGHPYACIYDRRFDAAELAASQTCH
jgi:hypothetical protein